jgi:hypothetical protein
MQPHRFKPPSPDIAKIVPVDTAMIWRGPMVIGALWRSRCRSPVRSSPRPRGHRPPRRPPPRIVIEKIQRADATVDPDTGSTEKGLRAQAY